MFVVITGKTTKYIELVNCILSFKEMNEFIGTLFRLKVLIETHRSENLNFIIVRG